MSGPNDIPTERHDDKTEHTARCTELARELITTGDAWADSYADPQSDYLERRDIATTIDALQREADNESTTCPGCQRGGAE